MKVNPITEILMHNITHKQAETQIERFEQAARDYEMKGSFPPEEQDEVISSWQNQKMKLRIMLFRLIEWNTQLKEQLKKYEQQHTKQ